MTTSGTTTFQDSFDLFEIIEEAWEQVGIEVRGGYDLRTARRSLNLLMKEWANRGINLWTILETTQNVSAGSSTVTLEDDTIDTLDVLWRTNSGQSDQNDRIMTRLSVSEWAHTANKEMTATPTQYWVNRITPPVMYIWPQPTSDGILVYWRLRRVQDAGDYTNTMDVPPRFLPAMTAGLAFYLAIKTPAASSKLPFLQQEYERQFQLAADEDREKASVFLVPDVRITG